MKKVLLISLATIAAVGMMVFLFEAVGASANSTPKSTTGESPQTLDGEINTDISAEITLKVDFATVVLTNSPGNGGGSYLDGITGGLITGSHTWTVVTNDEDGYELWIKETGAGQGGELRNEDDPSNFYFADFTGNGADYNTPAAWTSPAAASGYFGYTLTAISGGSTVATNGIFVTAGSGNYAPISTNSVKLVDSVDETELTGDTATLLWQAEWTTGPGYLRTGRYSDFVTVTANVTP